MVSVKIANENEAGFSISLLNFRHRVLETIIDRVIQVRVSITRIYEKVAKFSTNSHDHNFMATAFGVPLSAGCKA